MFVLAGVVAKVAAATEVAVGLAEKFANVEPVVTAYPPVAVAERSELAEAVAAIESGAAAPVAYAGFAAVEQTFAAEEVVAVVALIPVAASPYVRDAVAGIVSQNSKVLSQPFHLT